MNGRRILDRLLDAFGDLFEDVILVSNRPMLFFPWNVRIVSDVFSDRSSLTGIHSALFYAASSHVFVTACDLPFLKKEVIQTLLHSVTERTDVLVPETPDGIQPLCAVYSKRCLMHVEALLKARQFKIRMFYPKVRVTRFPEKELRAADPRLVSFVNINSPEELAAAERIEKTKTDGQGNAG